MDPCGWGVRVAVGTGLFDFVVRLDPQVPTGPLRWHCSDPAASTNH